MCNYQQRLKGQSHEIFDTRFFRQTIPLGRLHAMRHRAELQLSAMPHSAESTQICDISAKSKPNSEIFKDDNQ
jgi:hypothetical protein